MGQHYGPVPPAGEHTVSKAVAVGRTDERLVFKTFLIPFGVYQKEFACRGETRPGGRAEAFEKPPALGKSGLALNSKTHHRLHVHSNRYSNRILVSRMIRA
jgi:hypothetical protein